MAKKPRKWSNLKGQLPDAPPELPEREQRIRAAMDERRTITEERRGLSDQADGSRPATIRDYAQEFRELLLEDGFEELAQKERSIKYDALERLILQELKRIEDLSGQDMFRGEGVTFSPKHLLIPIVEDKQVLRDWVVNSGREAMLQLRPEKLKEIVSDAMDTDLAATMTPAQRAELKPGEPGSGAPPPGVKLFLKDGVNWRKA